MAWSMLWGLALWLCCGWVYGAEPIGVLREAERIHDLPPDQVPGARVALQAVVTYYDPAEDILFVQDATGGVFVNVRTRLPVTAGDVVSLQGSVKYGFRAGVAPDVHMEVVGRRASIVPQEATYPVLASGALDCRLVRLRGVVRDAVIEQHPESHSNILHMDVAVEGGEAEVYVHEYDGLDPMRLLGQQVSLTAVAGGSFNAKQQMNGVVLYAQTSEAVRVVGQPQQPYFALPLSRADDIFPAVHLVDESRRLRVRGTVISYMPGESVVLEQGERSVFIQTRQTSGITVGNVVEAYGFPDNHNYSPSLRDAIVVDTSVRQIVAPKFLSYDQALSGLYADRLVTVEGTVLSQLRSAEANSVTLEVSGHTVRGTLQDPAGVPELPIGSRVRMTGICHVITGGPWKEPVLFSLSVRSAADLRIMRGPSWWNVHHLADLLGLLLLVFVLISAWALLLRRRVAMQKARIERSMLVAEKRSSVLKQLSSNPALEEVLGSIVAAAEALLPGCRCIFERAAPVAVAVAVASAGTAHRPSMFHHRVIKNGEHFGDFLIYGCLDQHASEQAELFLMLRELIPLAVENTALHEQLLYRSTHDPLTDLPNRRVFEERLDQLIVAAGREGTCFSVIYVDVDRFKAVNDRFGHKVGDLYLQAIGRRLRSQLRESCTVARVGGDEFVILIPDCAGSLATELCIRLEACFSSPFTLGSVALRGSASFGMASFPANGSTREELEQYADGAMYGQKLRMPALLLSSACSPVSG